ncbi:phosphodiester glycosidase family protein [Gloeothece verrucosa]|uniref:Phosphodiester glycosidase domain-containing protein n=1 Tax=Gloeothece verrucosa (strain PCC 7822) TaxID=497965 RepID=E0UI54_GLOV7|nr:phosphodiester glycosidase family protein [Gloeothece verrucosa]ADN15706.1 conserved hypothetical protein [Gloeothece verrucosa PCC 7822]
MREDNWHSLSIFSFSFVAVAMVYHVTNNFPAQPPQLNKSEIAINSETILTNSPRNFRPQTLLAQSNLSELQQGNEISINGRKYSVAWSQWQEGTSTRIGISDTGVMNILGVYLLSTRDPEIQPVVWFNNDPNQPTILKAKFIAPYRYLDLTDILQTAGTEIQAVGNTLNLNIPPAQIQNIRQGDQSWGKRIVIDLDRPTFWLVSQAKNEGAVLIEGIANSQLMGTYQPLPIASPNASRSTTNEDDLGTGSNAKFDPQLFSLTGEKTTTKLLLNLPTAYGIRVFSLSNPPRLVVDVRPDEKVEREIQWTPGIVWRQQIITAKGDLFPVTSLLIDLNTSNISFKPVTSNANSLEGTAPIAATARITGASAAINGGFFNRNNKLPLGAIRSNNRWLSGPILNRGAIAWNEKGEVKIGRLRLQETLTTNNGNQIPIGLVNSGYIQGGMARYTRDWGSFYTPLSDNEIIITVENNQVIEQRQASSAAQNQFPIPAQGYLLIIRKNAVAASSLIPGTQVNLNSATIPPEFNRYPQILGAGPLLLLNGQIVLDAAAEQFSKGFQEQKASRSAIATTRGEKLILVAVHNRVGGTGATLAEFAQILQALGAVDALNLDGGSSTSLALGGQLIDRSPVTAAKVHNGIGVFINPKF